MEIKGKKHTYIQHKFDTPHLNFLRFHVKDNPNYEIDVDYVSADIDMRRCDYDNGFVEIYRPTIHFISHKSRSQVLGAVEGIQVKINYTSDFKLLIKKDSLLEDVMDNLVHGQYERTF